MASLTADFKTLEASYGDDVLHLVIASGYLSRLVANPAIEQWLAARHPEILSGFRSIISVASLDVAAADGDDDAAPTDEDDAPKGGLWPRPRPEAVGANTANGTEVGDALGSGLHSCRHAARL